MVWYGMVWYGMVWYGMVWYGMVWYGVVAMIWYGMVWYDVKPLPTFTFSIDHGCPRGARGTDRRRHDAE